MDLRVIGVLLLIPLLDVMLLVILATRIGPVTIGPVATVALVVLTAFIGLLLVRAEGRHTLAKMQQRLANGEPPTDELLDGALLLIAGTLMVTPGLVTDLIGLLLVFPPTRYPIHLVVKRYMVRPYLDAKTGGFATGNVYIGGFPNGDGSVAGGAAGSDRYTAGRSSGAQPGNETVDMGDDEYEFTDVDDDDTSDDQNSPP